VSLAACAALVERGDPDRFLSAMSAPPEDRARLWPLYAFNLEVARAPWASAEPILGGMRLQFWADTLEAIAAGGAVPAHEVAEPLAALVREAGLPVDLLAGMVAARRRDLEPEGFADAAALWAYLAATGGALTEAAARALGGAAAAGAAREAGTAAALANWFLAVPELARRGRRTLPAPAEALAAEGLARLAKARRAGVPRRAVPALRAGWRADALLRQALRAPALVAAGGLGQSEFARRGSLLWRSLTGSW
jgi:phytoene synthase